MSRPIPTRVVVPVAVAAMVVAVLALFGAGEALLVPVAVTAVACVAAVIVRDQVRKRRGRS